MVLGIFKEGLHIIVFTLTSDLALNPVTVQLTVTDLMGFSEDIPMSIAAGLTQFKGSWDDTGRALGAAQVEASAEDLEGHLAVASGEVELKSSYGRHHGEAYGDGL